MDPAPFGGHSLRAGLVTDLLEAGVPDAVTMGMTGHKSANVFRGYYRPKHFERNLTAAAGL